MEDSPLPTVFRNRLWTAPGQLGLRFLALADSASLFLERLEATAELSMEAARGWLALESVAAENSVAIFNQAGRVEALMDLFAGADRLLSQDFLIVPAIGLTPHVTRQLGPWSLRTEIRKGLWTVEFAKPPGAETALYTALEQRVLKPWIKRRHVSVHSPRLDAASGRTDQSIIELKISYPHQDHPHDVAALHRYDAPHVRLIRIHIDDDRSIATSALELQGHAPKLSVSTTTPDAADPIQNAIAIREQLQRTVRFIDSTKWAKWRGIVSNPSAALGKYKQRGRVFAVRVSKSDLYPAFQFTDDAEPLPIMEKILNIIPEEARGWSLLSWFEAQNTLLQNQKPSSVLARDPEAVLNAASRFYSRDH